MTNQPRLLAVALALSAAGCSLIVDPKAKDPLKTADGFCNSVQDVANALACGVFSKGPAMPIQVQAQPASDQLFSAYRGRCDALKAAVDAGRFTYDAAAAQGCISALERGGCRAMDGEYFEWPAACSQVIRGNVAPGGACLYGSDVDAASPKPALQGTTRFSLNECSQGALCYSQLQCPGVCKVPSSVAGSACGTPSNPEGCAEGLTCSGSMCVVLGQPGIPCLVGCDPRTAACNYNSTLCERLPTVGEACSTSLNPPCASGLLCDYAFAPTCISRPVEPIARGGYCGSLGSSFCADGTYCDGFTGTCIAQRTSGSCTYSEECAPGHGCQYMSMSYVCAPLAGKGGACRTDMTGTQCQPGLVCNAPYMVTIGVCDLLPGLGAACIGTGATSYCAPGLRPVTSIAPSSTCTCQPYLGEGANCTMSDECGYFAGTGRACVWNPVGGVNVCQSSACGAAAGWFATGAAY